MKRAGLQLLLFLEITAALQRAVASVPAGAGTETLAPNVSAAVTNIGQLRTLSYLEFNRGRPVCLTGTVTLVDNERRRLVLQDVTGALMWYCDAPVDPALIGKTVRVTCAYGSPYIPTLPDFPYRPSGSDFQSSFEAPPNWGNYHLTRMAGYLHPPTTGEYTFWIASDDSSELWLSTDENPTHVKKIAFVMEGFWTNPHEWGRFPSQCSERIHLEADRAYYFDAFQEQGLQADHLSVAWEGPSIAQSVIPGACLTPWSGVAATSAHSASQAPAKGVVREYWTNYAAGSVRMVTASGAADAGFAGRDVSFQVIGPGRWPQPQPINPSVPLQPDNNFRWVQTEGILNFVSTAGEGATLELMAGPKRVVVRVARWNQSPLQTGLNRRVQVRGVCEGVADENEVLTTGFIWVPTAEEVRVIEAVNDSEVSVLLPDFTPTNAPATFGGFYIARGVVTFDGRVAGKRCLYVQDAHGGVFISDADRVLPRPLEVGQRVQAGGTLSPARTGLKLVPMTMRLLGWQSLPAPSEPGTEPAFRDGQWTEVRGVVRSIRPDGVLAVKGPQGLVSVWSHMTPVDESLVDCTVRIRGVLSLETADAPLLLVGSSQFIETEDRGPRDPFSLPRSAISDLGSPLLGTRGAHRIKVEGTITYARDDICFLQDNSGAARVQVPPAPAVRVGDRVEVVGFPDLDGPIRVLAEPKLRMLGNGEPLEPRELDLSDAVRNNGSLVRVRASLLARKNRGRLQVLELQTGPRAFEGVLASDTGQLPPLAAGSLLEVTGVCVADVLPVPSTQPGNSESPSVAALQLLLRTPTDITVRRAPPWWTPKKVVMLIGFLLTMLGGTFLWMRLLERRYELRQRAQLEFSRQTLRSQETERRRIAANLHDSLGQNLLVIKNQVRRAMQPDLDQPALLERLNEISGMASQVIDEVRQITHDLRPGQLDRVGLSRTLRGTIRRVSESCPITFASHVDEIDGLFDTDGEIHIYRILQEGLHNVVKHSRATEATAVVKKEDNSLLITVRDNGCGVANGSGNGALLPHAGLGLSSISERARILHGKAAFDSAPGQGFRLTVEIPLPGNHETP